MSIANYRRCVKEGVAGADKPVCLPAAMDLCTESGALSPDLYLEYAAFVESELQGKDFLKNFKSLMRHILLDLDGTDLSEAEWMNFTNRAAFSGEVRRYLDAGERVVVILGSDSADETHAVSLKSIPGKKSIRLLSNQLASPKLKKITTLGSLASKLHKPELPAIDIGRYPFEMANVVVLPPAR